MGSQRRLVFAVAGSLFLPFVFAGTVQMPGSLPAPWVQAITALSSIQKAQRLYATACGNGGYASSIGVLLDPVPGTSTAFLSEHFARYAPGDYVVTVAPGADTAAGTLDCHGNRTVSRFYASAVPAARSRAQRSYATTQDGTIWQVKGPSAPAEPFHSPATRIQ